tara:strand:- start:23 stop:163 length:141 start_codon:yes stop_codon:yes gene_type:complete
MILKNNNKINRNKEKIFTIGKIINKKNIISECTATLYLKTDNMLKE